MVGTSRRAAKSAPNVLLIITDDAGFGVPSTFGGVIPTPVMDAVANEGLRYNANLFNCAVLADAGGTHHRAQPSLRRLRRGLGAVDGLPRLQQHSLARTRQRSGASCAITDIPRRGSARPITRRPLRPARSGPFDQWPTGMGFEYFYGFIGGDANQWQPNLFRNTTQVYPFWESRPAPGTWSPRWPTTPSTT